MNRQRIIQITMISIAMIFFLGLLIYTVDFIFYKDNRIKNHLAGKFCECAMSESVQEGEYELTKDGFMYALELNSCFAEEFAKYKGNMTDKMREQYIEEINDRIFKKCPDPADKVLTPPKGEELAY